MADLHGAIDRSIMISRPITNHTFDEIAIGATDVVCHRLSATDVEALSLVAGDPEPFHLESDGNSTGVATAPGATAVALVSGILNRRLPGPGSAIVGTRFAYAGRLHVGDTLTATVTVRAKHASGQPDRLRVPLHQRAGRGAGRRRGHRQRADAAHRLLGYRHAGGGAAPQRRPGAPAAGLRRTRTGSLRHRPSLRPRLAARCRRGGAARADRAGAGRAGGEDPRDRGAKQASTSRRSGSCRRRTAMPRRRRPWRWRAPARSRR